MPKPSIIIITATSLLLALCTASPAQESHKIDSLNQVINSATRDTVAGIALIALSELYFANRPDTVIPIALQVKRIAHENLERDDLDATMRKTFLKLISYADNNIGYVKFHMGEVDSSISYFKKSLAIRKEIGDVEGTASSLNNLGAIHYNAGDVPEAISYYQESVRLNEKVNNLKGLSLVLNNLGAIYYGQGNIPLALEMYHKSLRISEKLNNQPSVSRTLNNIGMIFLDQDDFSEALKYLNRCLKINREVGDRRSVSSTLLNMGRLHEKQQNLEEAENLYHQANAIHKELADFEGLGYSLNNLGAIREKRGDLAGAMDCFKESLVNRELTKDKKAIAQTLNNIAGLSFKMGETDTARSYALESLSLAQEIGFPDYLKKAYWTIYSINKKEGKWRDALANYELYIAMKDSVVNADNKKAAIRQQTRYEFEKAQLVKEQEEKERQRQMASAISRRNNLQYSVVLICLLALGGGLAALGRFSISVRVAEGLIFFSFLIFFEFLLVLADPYIEDWSGGAPGIKLLFNAGVAALIFPLHSFFEGKLKQKLVKGT